MKKLEETLITVVGHALKESLEIYTSAELYDDYKTVNDTYDTKEKRRIAEKYGVDSKKASDISMGILKAAVEERKTKSTFDSTDVRMFLYMCNYDNYNKMLPFYQNENVEFLKFLKNYFYCN